MRGPPRRAHGADGHAGLDPDPRAPRCGWPRTTCASRRSGRGRSRGSTRRWRSTRSWGRARCARASRPRPPEASPASSAGTASWSSCARRSSVPGRGTGRSWRSSARRASASHASTTSSPTPTGPRAGSSWRAARSPTERPRHICRSPICSAPTSRSTRTTTRARSARRWWHLDPQPPPATQGALECAWPHAPESRRSRAASVPRESHMRCSEPCRPRCTSSVPRRSRRERGAGLSTSPLVVRRRLPGQRPTAVPWPAQPPPRGDEPP